MFSVKMATSKHTQKVGFDCEFVEKPQEAFQSDCPVCLQVLCEPYQVSCCGNSFCQVCIERIKTDNKPCPTCSEKNIKIFHNKGLQRSLYGFQVYCSHKREGCEWKGELGQLDNHLKECEYSEIECNYCSELIKHPNITVHQTDLCPKRPFSCEYCQKYSSHYEDVINSHWPVCGYHPVQCPNECGIFPQRQALKNHVTRDCPKTVIDCDFHHVGCDVRLPRKDMPAHLNKNLVTHMSLQARSHTALQNEVECLKKENKMLKENQLTAISILQQKITALDKYITDLQAATVPHSGISPCELIMTNYTQYRKTDTEWFSPPFYSHHKGYKFCLNVCLNSKGDNGEGTYIAVYLRLMRGEFDDYLIWPCKRRFLIQLVDREEQGKHYYTETIIFNDTVPNNITSRVTRYRKTMNDGWGHDSFILQDKLQPRDNCLCFRITVIEIM